MVETVNLFEPRIRANPYPTYARLRRQAPVSLVEPGGIWAVARWEDGEYVLRHPELFSSAGTGLLLNPGWLKDNPLSRSIICLDPPSHTKLRSLIAHGFTPSRVSKHEPLVRSVIKEEIERVRREGETDFVSDFSVPVTARIIARMIGLDSDLHRNFKRWTDVLTSISPVPPPPEDARAAHVAIEEMSQYLSEVIDARRRQPTEDLVSQLLAAKVDGTSLTTDEIRAFLFLLLPAGFETVATSLSNLMLEFSHRPQDVDFLREHPHLIPAYSKEALRLQPSLHGVVRNATRDVELNGVTIPGGAMVLVLLGSMNRDEERFEDPDQFRIDRNEKQASFGMGVHYCLGASLAQLERVVVIEELVKSFERFEPLGDLARAWNRSLFVRSLLELPIRYVPRHEESNP